MQSIQLDELPSSVCALQAAIGCPGTVHISALLNNADIQALTMENPALFKLAHIFSYGTVEDLDSEIPPAWLHKLRQLSLITYATKSRQLSYEDLMRKLKLTSQRDLEDVVIDAMYNGMIKGRLNSNSGIVMIDDWTARDVQNSNDLLPQMTNVLNSWLDHASKTQNEALELAERDNLEMNLKQENKLRADCEIQEARQNIEDMMNRTHDMTPTTSETTPRNKRRGILTNRTKK